MLSSSTMKYIYHIMIYVKRKTEPLMSKVMHHFSGHQSRRACALWGPEAGLFMSLQSCAELRQGIGKTALGVEFVHFAAAPGRHFSPGRQ